MYHLIINRDEEFLTQNDSTAEMAVLEGCFVLTDLTPDRINQYLEYHEDWTQLPVR